jgi:hypothetical protein
MQFKGLRVQMLFISIIGILTLFFGTSMRIKVSFDGVLYLLSARSLFTNQMGEQYQWIREPGYPFFLRVILGGGDRFDRLVLAQSALIGISTVVVFLYCYSRSKTLLHKSILFVAGIISFLLVIGYASWMLQQAAFIGLTALHVLYLWVVTSNPTKVKTYLFASSITLFITGLISIIVLPASLLVILLGAFKLSSATRLSMTKIGFYVFVTLIPVLIFNISWSIYKAGEISTSTRIHPDAAFIIEHVGDSSILESVYLIPANISGILGFGFEKTSSLDRPQTVPAGSHYYFGFGNGHSGLGCAKFDQGPAKALELLRLDFSKFSDCSYNPTLGYYNQVTESIEFVLPLLFFATFISVLYSIIKLKINEIQIAIFPLFSIVPYLFEPTITSRYGLPFFFISPFLLANLVKRSEI